MKSRFAALLLALQLVVAMLGGAWLGERAGSVVREGSAAVRSVHGASIDAASVRGGAPEGRKGGANETRVATAALPVDAVVVVPNASWVLVDAPRASAVETVSRSIVGTARGPPSMG